MRPHTHTHPATVSAVLGPLLGSLWLQDESWAHCILLVGQAHFTKC